MLGPMRTVLSISTVSIHILAAAPGARRPPVARVPHTIAAAPTLLQPAANTSTMGAIVRAHCPVLVHSWCTARKTLETCNVLQHTVLTARVRQVLRSQRR